MPLQEYIASDLEFVVRNTEGKDQVRNAAYVTRTAIEKAGRIME